MRRMVSVPRVVGTFALAGALLAGSAPARAGTVSSVAFERECFDLDGGTSELPEFFEDCSDPMDLTVAYNGSDPDPPHGVIFQTVGRSIAYSDEAYDGVTGADLQSMTFSSGIVDQLFSKVAVIRSDQDRYFKLGNRGEDGFRQHFEWEELIIPPAPTSLAAKPALAQTSPPGARLRYEAILTRTGNGAPLGGRVVRFLVEGVQACSATTGPSGSASCFVEVAHIPGLLRAQSYEAIFDGTLALLASRTTGPLAE